MSKENPLSHHEQLRYDYLLKNIHYLNEREKNEFAYLQEKLTLARGNSSSSLEQEREEQVDLPSYANRSRSQSKSQALSSPAKKKRRKLRLKRIFMVIFSLLVCVALAMVFMFLRGYQDASAKKTADARAAQVEVFNGQDTRDGVNILIMGTDGRIGQNSVETRTDSIMVLNVGGSDKKMKLVSFMRDNLVYIDGYSQVINGRKQTDNKLNVAYELGEQEGQKGAEMVRQVLKDNFDLDIKYYALVDFQAFATAIDTLFPDGVTIDAQFSTLNGRPLTEATVGDDLYATETESPTQTIKVGKQQMNGSTLLNYARFRDDDEADYGRTKRQQQVLTAILEQIKDPTKLFTGSEALGKVFAMTSTNVPYTFLLTNGLSVLDGAKNGIEKLTIPELGDWVDAYDVYGGLGLLVDQNKYQTKLAQMGLR
ncbi:LytR family transcriptional regulator [Streptococcus pneumoniae]|uniref:polyisoprenyl-teichoic acid--peptidoglycan teichoic acid transferase Psr n=1 Tax=Streptococcus pneumoniae TaxID=1313 RepID=UPI0005E09B1C|nr:polyisoprenyl-teichoic acid--peptidoglycan teichoic acid transferase Psr [Streptococcus pneumoniae]CEX25675.1 LytR family transcriptional regulator [Streptococcus pneumoniae]CJA47577.1 LytR family transcriptional regulator [Streptococcus pneumoniae]CJE25344.1 LytR family transcriptional regulator [Streptococcus pneumoniae]CJJ50584.1 LytR family transcriptional regulator [Streptococcus pneumoniae]CJK10323.1 LytR family transcriptional regulator [Streptococcus pneumoniae]